jgi:hypothetical protein
MGSSCSKDRSVAQEHHHNSFTASTPAQDPFLYDLYQRSHEYTTTTASNHYTSTTTTPSNTTLPSGQSHLLYRNHARSATTIHKGQVHAHHPTRLVFRRRTVRYHEEGVSGQHIYAIRFPKHLSLQQQQRDARSEQAVVDTAILASKQQYHQAAAQDPHPVVVRPAASESCAVGDAGIEHLYTRPSMMKHPKLASTYCMKLKFVTLLY